MPSPKGYKTVSGRMEVQWTVELPEELSHTSMMCDDPAVEAAMQGIHQHVNVYLWGEDKEAASVYCDVNELDVEVEEDER